MQRIAQAIEQQFQVVYHPHYVAGLLQQWEWSLPVPLPRAKERDEALIRACLAHNWPRLKKSAAERCHHRFFSMKRTNCVRFGFSFQEKRARVWAPKGKRPIVRSVESERRALSTAVGLTLSGKIYKRHFTDRMKSEQVIWALEHLQRHVPGGILLIWDRASIHTSRKTEVYLTAHPEISVEPLPAYAPEFNPEEYCHGNVKQHLKNVTPDTRREMCVLLNREFARFAIVQT